MISIELSEFEAKSSQGDYTETSRNEGFVFAGVNAYMFLSRLRPILAVSFSLLCLAMVRVSSEKCLKHVGSCLL